jgi:hypothetical protein
MSKHRLTIAFAAVICALGAAAAVRASIPDGSGAIHGCYSKSAPPGGQPGALRVVDTALGQSCTLSESAVTWSQTGPQGPQGPPGQQGPQGSPGAQGPTGAAGVSGYQVVKTTDGFSAASSLIGDSVTCPSGTRPLGGGGSVDGGSGTGPSGWAIWLDAPEDDLFPGTQGWAVEAERLSGSTAGRLTVYAVCASVSSAPPA